MRRNSGSPKMSFSCVKGFAFWSSNKKQRDTHIHTQIVVPWGVCRVQISTHKNSHVASESVGLETIFLEICGPGYIFLGSGAEKTRSSSCQLQAVFICTSSVSGTIKAAGSRPAQHLGEAGFWLGVTCGDRRLRRAVVVTSAEKV